MKKIFSIALMVLMALTATAQETPTRRFQLKTLPEKNLVTSVYYSWWNPEKEWTESRGWNSDTITIDVQVPVGKELSIDIRHDNINWAYHGDMAASIYTLVDWRENGEVTNSVVSDSRSYLSYTYVMPDYDVELVGTFEYNPTPPTDQPTTNGWYPETGTLVLDYNEYMPAGFTDSDYEKVVRVIFGPWSSYISHYFFSGGWAENNNYPNCRIADYSRTTAMEVSDYNTWKNIQLTDILLPPTVKTIYGRSFQDLSTLTTLTCYALTPPAIEPYYEQQWNSETYQYEYIDTVMPFDYSPDVVIRVPADVVPLYQRADYWKDFTILAIDENYANLTVNLMPTVEDERNLLIYKNMHLELTNIRTGIKRSMLVNGRNTYDFTYLPVNTAYNLVLRSQTGAVVAQIDNIYLAEENKTVTFDRLRKPHTLTLSLTADGQTVGNELFTNTWFTEAGAYIGKGNELANVFDDQTVKVLIGYERELAMRYQQPDTISIVVGQQPDNIVIELPPLPTADVTFRVSDERTRQGIADATVSIVQILNNGQAGTQQTLTTNADGLATGKVLGTMSNIIVNAGQFGSKNFFANLNDSTDFNVSFTPAEGTTITLNWSYVKAVYPEEAEDIVNDYADKGNMQLTLMDYSSYKELTDYRDQAPRYTLFETLPEGTTVYATATSLNDKVAYVTGSGIVDSLGQVSIDMRVVERATMHVSYFQSESRTPAILLFSNNSDNVVRKKTFEPGIAYIDFTNLPSGQYQVIAMGTGEAYEALTNKQQLARLTEGADYVSQTLIMEDGKNQRVSFTKIPLTSNTLTNNLATRRAMFKQRQVSVGEYATVSVTAAFKRDITATPKDISFVYRIPQYCNFVASSVMIGQKQVPYTYDSNTRELTVSWDNIETDSVMRFCLIPTQPDEYQSEAALRYTLDGEEHSDPLQTSTLTAVSAIINVPEVMNQPRFKVSGKSAASYDAAGSRAKRAAGIYMGTQYWKSEPHYDVEIFDGNELIGNANTNSNGEWDAWVTLKEPTALSHHTIWARVARNNTIVETERKEMIYDPNAVVPKSLTMTFFNHHPAHLEQTTVVFDYVNDKAYPSHYGFSNEEGYNTDFTFEVDLSTNDTTKVYACALYIHTAGPDAEERITMCHYNKRKNRWIAYEKFNTRSLPYDVYVEPFYYHDNIGSRKDIDNAYDWFDALYKKDTGTLADLRDELDALMKQGQQAHDSGNDDAIPTEAINEKLQQWFEASGLNEHEVEDTGETAEEIVADMDALWAEVGTIADYFGDTAGLAQKLNELGTIAQGMTTGKATDMNANSLKEQGYHENNLDDHSKIYILATEDGGWDFVDLNRDLRITVNGEAAELMGISSLHRAETASWEKTFETMKDYLDSFQDYLGKLADVATSAISKFNYWIYMAEDASVKLGKQLANPNLSRFERWWLETKLDLNLAKTTGLEKMRSLCTKFKVGDGVGTLASAYSLYSTYMKFSDNCKKLRNIRNGIPEYCPDDQADADNLRADINSFCNWSVPYMVTAISSDVIALGVAFGCFVGLIPSGGATTPGLAASLAKIGLTMAANYMYESRTEAAIEVFSLRKSALICFKKDPNCVQRGDCPKCTANCDDYPKGPKGPKGPTTTGDLDPSGYVYEGVASNRVEGATTTVYFKTTEKDMYGDNVEKIVMWDAEAFDQVNPQLTNENGEYGWMVPAGQWQVKYEKEGYQTVYSEWLPVPPPQLDVNQEMRQYVQPQVSGVKASQDGVQITFDKYMRPATLTAENITVSLNGEQMEGTIELLDSEADDTGELLTRRVRFAPAAQLPVGQTLMLTVSGNVESYAKMQMGDTFSQPFDIAETVEKMVADSLVNIIYDQTSTMTISALPAKAAAGQKVSVRLMSDVIASTEQTELTFDDNGKATLNITGEAHGTTAIELTLQDDEDVKALVVVNVKDESDFITTMPSANYMSNTQLYYGTKITLSCEQPDAVIYYTLDGSCPCEQESDHVFRYTGPIVANGPLLIKAMAIAPGYTESDINELHFPLLTGNTQLHLQQGWNWISHGHANAIETSTLGTATDQVLDTDGQTVSQMQPATAYLIHNNAQYEPQLTGYAFNPRTSTLSLSEGWNWMPYPVSQVLMPAEALAYAQPQNGDVLVGEDGFAIYVTDWSGEGSWQGTLVKMEPGRAYRYKTTTGRTFIVNTNVTESQVGNQPSYTMFHWYDRHAFATRMPIIATLYNEYGSTVSNDYDYELSAFVGDNCRGNGFWADQNNNLYINVLGEEGETVHFLVHNKTTDKYYTTQESITYTAELQGTDNSPVQLHIGEEANGVNGITDDSQSSTSVYSLEGVKIEQQRKLRKGVYVQQGHKVVIK